MSEEKQVAIKELMELLDALGILGVAGKKIAKDGIGVDDLAHVIELGSKLEQILDGFKGLKKIGEEIKDIEQDELLQIIGKVYSLVDKINEA